MTQSTNNNNQSELIRKTLLIQLEACNPLALPLRTLQEGLHLAGTPLSKNQILKELTYLADKQLLHIETPLLSPANKRYRLSANGQDLLQSEPSIQD